VKLPAHRAGLPGKDGSSFVKLTMTAHHDETEYVFSFPRFACPEIVEGRALTQPARRGLRDAPSVPFKNTLTGFGKSNNGITLFKEKGFKTT